MRRQEIGGCGGDLVGESETEEGVRRNEEGEIKRDAYEGEKRNGKGDDYQVKKKARKERGRGVARKLREAQGGNPLSISERRKLYLAVAALFVL